MLQVVLKIVLKILAAALVTEAVTEILVASYYFEAFRKWVGGEKEAALEGKFGLKGYLVWCGYCVSVSVGIGASYLLRIRGALPYLSYFEPLVWGLAVHRCSNLVHEGHARILKRIPLSLFLRSWVTHETAPPPPLPPTPEGASSEEGKPE